jgi:nicotinamide phosphoribosyltransferase
MTNLLLATDVYKMGHLEQYPSDTDYIYSYMTARSSKKYKELVFYGLQYYLKEYLFKPITHSDVTEYLSTRQEILGFPLAEKHVKKLRDLADLGYLPILIKSVAEGTILPIQNILFSMENTIPGYGWLVGALESLLLKVWYPTTVATASKKYRKLIDRMADLSSERDQIRDFLVHDFGYRGVSSEESAALAGSAHLINFKGTDTVPAIPFIKKYYNSYDGLGFSVPASEHSVMCAYGKEGELAAFNNLLDIYPSGILSIVSDTYNLWDVLTSIIPQLKDRILGRDGKVVIRPDSGDPKKILLGDPQAKDERARKGVFNILFEIFGSTLNTKGYRQLNDKIGVIYGDGMYYERFEDILSSMVSAGIASDNLVIGVGGLLLQQHNRDDLGFSFKATHLIKNNGEEVMLFKNPITDTSKKSHTGRMVLVLDDSRQFVTIDNLSLEKQNSLSCKDLLKIVYIDGKLYNQHIFSEIRMGL